jgi:hypothetical protein
MDSRRLPSGSARSPATCPPWGSSVSSGTGSPNTHRFGYCVLSVFLSTHLSFYNIVTLAGLAGMFSNMFCLSFYQLFNLFTTLLCQPVLAGYFLLCSVCLSINLSVFLQFCYTSRFWWEYYIITLSFFFHLVTVTGFQEYLSFYLFWFYVCQPVCTKL